MSKEQKGDIWAVQAKKMSDLFQAKKIPCDSKGFLSINKPDCLLFSFCTTFCSGSSSKSIGFSLAKSTGCNY